MTNPSKDNEKIINDYDYLGNACSSTDCTGLIPSAPQSEAELDSPMRRSITSNRLK